MIPQKQAGKQVAAGLPDQVPAAERRLARTAGEQPCSKWSVYRHAIEDGWGATLRLCLILAVSLGGFGVLAATAVKIVSILWGHTH
jgi:hypothetical protein